MAPGAAALTRLAVCAALSLLLPATATAETVDAGSLVAEANGTELTLSQPGFRSTSATRASWRWDAMKGRIA